MENEEQDVNVENQTVPLVDNSDEEGDEETIAPPDEKELKQQLAQMSQGKEEFQPSAPSSDEEEQLNSEEDTETEENETTDENTKDDSEPSQVQIKPVDGETPRERALRKQLKLARDKEQFYKNQQLLSLSKKDPEPVDEEFQQLKQTYSDEYINEMERLFDVIGKKKGFVRETSLYAQTGNNVLNEFLDKHSEYKAENDIDDARWTLFRSIIAEDYNLNNKTPEQLKSIFNKVHRDVEVELGLSGVSHNANKISAQQQKIRSVSHSGGTKSQTSKTSRAPTDPKIRAMFKGFDDDDF